MSLGQFNSNPTCGHLLTAKGVLYYLAGTVNLALKYNFLIQSDFAPIHLLFPTSYGFADANWASDMKT